MKLIINHRLLILFIISLVFSWACDNQEVDPEDPNQEERSLAFFRVYDDDRFEASYLPVDLVEREDGTFLLLSGFRLPDTDFVGAQVFRIDEDGTLIGSQSLDAELVQPAKGWFREGDQYGFLCMQRTSLQSRKILVSANGSLNNAQSLGIQYPSVVYQVEGSGDLVIQGYDPANRNTVIGRFNSQGQMQGSRTFFIGAGEGVEKPIVEHFTRTGRSLPFLVGRTGGDNFYFNGFNNFTMSMVFFSFGGGEGAAIVQGQQDKGAISAALPLGGNRFALSRFNFGDNYFLPSVELNTTGLSSGVDYGGLSMPELVPNAPVQIERATVRGRDVLIYASETRNKEIILLVYDASSSELLGNRYLGFANPFEFAAMTLTQDGGLAIAGTTFLAGRFARPCLFKLSEADLFRIVLGNRDEEEEND